MTGRWLRGIAAVLLLGLIAVPAGTGPALGASGAVGQAAQQQEPLKAEIKRMAPLSDGLRAQATVALTGLVAGVRLEPGAFRVTIGGRPAKVTNLEAPGEAGRNVSALLVIDTSRSMTAKNNIGRAKEAARAFVDQLQPGGMAGLLAFADRPTSASLTDKKAQLNAGIDRLQAEGEKTALFDAVVAATQTLRQAKGDRAVILLSDGDDNNSTNMLPQAIRAAQKAHVTVYAFALDSGAQVPRDALKKLAKQTKGRYLPAQGSQLASLYTSLGQELYSRYVVEVEIPPGTQPTSNVLIEAQVGQASVSAEGVLALPVAKPVARGLDQQPVPGLGRLETQQGLYFIAALMFAAVLLLAWALMAPLPGGGKSYRELRQRLSQYSLTSALSDDPVPEGGGLGSNQLLGRAAQVAEALIRRSHLEEALLTRLELAGLKLRVGEMAMIWLASALGIPLLLLAISHNLLLAFVGALLGTLVPLALLVVRASRRQAKFDEQLPDTLQLLSGAMQAGHSLLQAVDTAAREAGEPISVEFQRVLTEARLGMPLEEALGGMAKRMNSQDFEWTVMAIALQRQVGGNLAELLNAVAQTIRERYTLRRQVRALSAEGRLSSVILTVLPFIMFFALLTFNPTFLAPLFSTALGLAMLSGAAILMIVGVVWMKKITEIEV
jgi:tight adherence protein B